MKSPQESFWIDYFYIL